MRLAQLKSSEIIDERQKNEDLGKKQAEPCAFGSASHAGGSSGLFFATSASDPLLLRSRLSCSPGFSEEPDQKIKYRILDSPCNRDYLKGKIPNGVLAQCWIPAFAGTIPHQVFMAFQLMLAILAPALLTGLFASKLINPAAADGLFHGNPRQLLNPAIAVQVAWIYSRVVSLVIINLIDWAIGLRVDLDQEIEGLDSSQHGETGYSLEA